VVIAFAFPAIMKLIHLLLANKLFNGQKNALQTVRLVSGWVLTQKLVQIVMFMLRRMEDVIILHADNVLMSGVGCA